MYNFLSIINLSFTPFSFLGFTLLHRNPDTTDLQPIQKQLVETQTTPPTSESTTLPFKGFLATGIEEQTIKTTISYISKTKLKRLHYSRYLLRCPLVYIEHVSPLSGSVRLSKLPRDSSLGECHRLYIDSPTHYSLI